MSSVESDHRGRILTRIARDQLERILDPDSTKAPTSEETWSGEPWLFELGAVFVTLRSKGALRGCVGSLSASQPLIEDVRANTVAAATRDHRFVPLSREELDAVRIEIAELSEPRPMRFEDEADALAQLRPGVDGVVFGFKTHRATFLPQVWDSLPEPEEFLAQLKRKAGLALDFWDDGVELERYQVRKWLEPIE